MNTNGVSRVAFTVPEAAELTGFSENALRLRIHRGTVPVVRVGRAIRVPAGWVEGFNPDPPAAMAQAA